MKLRSVRVKMYRNILDSSEVQIDDKVTCLVGKNESGKSAFLNALWRLMPARTNPTFSIPDHYPAWLEKRHRNEGVDQGEVTPIEVKLEWEASDVKCMEEKFGTNVVKVGSAIKLSKTYNNEFTWDNDINEKQALKNFLKKLKLPSAEEGSYHGLDTFKGLIDKLIEDIKKYKDDPESLQLLNEMQKAQKFLFGECKSFNEVVWSVSKTRFPEFLYFAEYSKLPYSVKIHRILKEKDLSDSEATARALLRLGGTEDEYMLNPNYERRKRELENVANVLSEDVNNYWSQNPELRVQPDITQITESHSGGQQSVLNEMKVRIWDNRHSLSLPFDEHSAGFQWFFSFLAAFSEYERRDPAVVILLDEPAIGLHAKAQSDFLRFIEERLTKRCQVIYTTHSPFMVQPGNLERVRLVEDKGKEFGALVTSDVLTIDRDTIFPLQGALGYDLVQHLFVSEHNLVVEGTSDYAYLKIVSDHLSSITRTGLDPKWSIVPVGGADLIPTFVALLGNHLNVTVLVDSRKEGHQKLDRLSKDGYLEKQRIILLGDVLGKPSADIEDLFSEEEYLELYNKAFGKKIKISDLKGSDPIVSRIARLEGIERFNHGFPADVFLRERETIISKLSEPTFMRFENLFTRINGTLTIK
jgi:predicted ATP-dependent endonuclease of OLD family